MESFLKPAHDDDDAPPGVNVGVSVGSSLDASVGASDRLHVNESGTCWPSCALSLLLYCSIQLLTFCYLSVMPKFQLWAIPILN